MLGQYNSLTHWGWVTHTCISKLTLIGLDNGLLPGMCQTIIWTNAGILLTGPLTTNFSEILINQNSHIFIRENAFEMSSGKWQLFCLSLNVLTVVKYITRNINRQYATTVIHSSTWLTWFPDFIKVTIKDLRYNQALCQRSASKTYSDLLRFGFCQRSVKMAVSYPGIGIPIINKNI